MTGSTLAYTPEVARATAPLYDRVRHVIPELEWPVHAPYVEAIRRLKRERRIAIALFVTGAILIGAIQHFFAPAAPPSFVNAPGDAETHGEP